MNNPMERQGIMQQSVPFAPVVLFTGNYGSGKTEVAVNYSGHFARSGTDTKIVDLDLVNPYFRCREARDQLEEMGVTVVAPGGDYHNADLPILLPQVRGAIENSTGLSVLDVGGDNVGATVLAGLVKSFTRSSYEMNFVLNKNRPFTGTVEGALQMMSEIEAASGLQISAIVSNTHLMDETTVDMIVDGVEFAHAVAEAKGVKFAFVAVEKRLLDDPKLSGCKSPVLAIERMLLPPWKQVTAATVTHARDGFARISAKYNS
jgi:hypothetical protein